VLASLRDFLAWKSKRDDGAGVAEDGVPDVGLEVVEITAPRAPEQLVERNVRCTPDSARSGTGGATSALGQELNSTIQSFRDSDCPWKVITTEISACYVRASAIP
jgi:hypothetical protein